MKKDKQIEALFAIADIEETIKWIKPYIENVEIDDEVLKNGIVGRLDDITTDDYEKM